MRRGSSAAFVIGLLFAVTGSAAGDPGTDESWLETIVERIDYSAQLELAGAVQTSDSRAQALSFSFSPDVELELPHDFRLRGIARLRADTFDRLEPGTPRQDSVSILSRRLFLGDNVELELRELYLEGEVGPTYLVIGKQQVVWGKSDGLKVLDVVNPQYFREFILEDFEASQIPLWTVNAELAVGDATLQLLWIPDPTFHSTPGPDGAFAFTTPRLAPPPPRGLPVVLHPPDRPRNHFSDSDAGGRLETFIAGWNLSLNYLYHYADTPIAFRAAPAAPTTPIVVTPRWKRTHLVGGTFSRAIADFVLRGEAGYSTRRFFPTTGSNDLDGAARTAELRYVLGVDWYGIRSTLVSFQLFQSWLPSHSPGMTRDELDTTMTLLLRRTFLHETLTIDGIWIHNVNDGDGLVRPRARYEIRDGLELEVGLDLFYGPKQGVFGEFRDRSRAQARLRYSF